ncbi:MAG TPA: malto-oligosyltrehalose trehalohydrolase [Vicinamibacterales bacterium]|nr:malto-oligosyltrehalose trehalohydrolase [Vicinamibacterales bacterium]
MSTPVTDTRADEAFFGAVPSHDGVRFRIWSPDARRLTLVIHSGAAAGEHPLARAESGVFETWVRGAAAGDRYAYTIDGSETLPDPASRFQPEGVHGPSEVVDPQTFAWTDTRWRPRIVNDLVVYELHVGTFSPEGTFVGVEARLPYLRDLGITAIELMPVADFAGGRNWGYDGVALFAPSRAYGRPDDLRRLVDAAHRHGLSVILDVVYNHLGPEGAYLPRFSSRYLTEKHHTPWGGAVNLDDRGSEHVRRFILDNALHWIREYHIDGLRLDATHALIDHSSRHFIEELVATLRGRAGRNVVIHAEDHRNKAGMIEDPAEHGWGLDGVWADDFHHVVRRMTAGDEHGYFADFAGTSRELAAIIRQGWLYTGQHSRHMNHARGTDPSHVPMHRFVVCIQNHDQIGNRAMGDRLHHTIDAAAWRAASVVLLTAPMTPLLFMGQEWAASSPFQYFTDLEPELGALVTEGRRREFADFPEFSSPDARERIPDPQAATTFENSRLRWDELTQGDHRRSLALYRQLLALRREYRALAGDNRTAGQATAPDDESLVVRRSDGRDTYWVVARFRSGGTIGLVEAAAALDVDLRGLSLELVLDTEHAEFAEDPPAIGPPAGAGLDITFARAGAVILRER